MTGLQHMVDISMQCNIMLVSNILMARMRGINDEQWREWGFDIHWSGFTG